MTTLTAGLVLGLGLPSVALGHSVGVDLGAGAPSGTVGLSARYQPMPAGFLEVGAGQGITGTQVGFGLASVLGRRTVLGQPTQLYAIGAFSLGFQEKEARRTWTPRSVRAAGTYHWVNAGVGFEWYRRGGVSLGSEAGVLVRMALVRSDVEEPPTPRHVGAYSRLLRLGFAF